jgi:hypothetical protein
MAEVDYFSWSQCLAYITVARFWSNQQRLDANCARAESLGAVRQGSSLLDDLLVYGQCGRRLLVQYINGDIGLCYSYLRGAVEYGEPPCRSLFGQRLDELVSQQVLTVLEPVALELHLTAATDVEREQQRLHRHWQQQLERARYQTNQTARHFHAVEPENRLVGRELERR